MSKPCTWCIETSERIDSLEQLQEYYLKLKAENAVSKINKECGELIR